MNFIDGTPVQLTLDDLLNQLNKTPGDPVNWPVPPEDIGGELLSILSKGLYPSPLDCIREYVQNSVDAGANVVTVKITGNSVIIHDDGNGMTLNQLYEARKFGVSPKSMFESVGFRGIGIYSGFDICERLIITTRNTSEESSYKLEFDFKAMRAQLDVERREARKRRTPVNKLIEQYSNFRGRPDRSSASYTSVQLENLSDAHIDLLMDREKLRKYMLRNLPIDFDDDFEHKKTISENLVNHINGYNAVIIKLETDREGVEIITRPAIPNLSNPTLGYIYNSKNKSIAYYWACLHLGEESKYGMKGARLPDAYDVKCRPGVYHPESPNGYHSESADVYHL